MNHPAKARGTAWRWLLLASCLWQAAPLLAATPTGAHNTQALPQLAVTAAQSQRLGIQTLTLAADSGMRLAGLPAQVVVPNEQLRIIATPLPGAVQALLVAPGMTVKQGQPLARLNSREALELQRDLRQTAAQAELSRQTWQRDQTLHQEGLIAEARLQASRAAWQQAEAAASERRQALSLVGTLNADGITLKAPSDGVVLEQHATLGERLDASASLYTLARLDPLWLEIQVPAELAVSLRLGMPVQAGAAQGRIITIAAAVQPASQSVLVRARMEGAAEHGLTLRPGQHVQASIELSGMPGHSLPAAAVIRHEGRSVVFVGTRDGYRVVDVKLLQESGDMLQVSGLTSGMTVVVHGASSLKALWTGIGGE